MSGKGLYLRHPDDQPIALQIEGSSHSSRTLERSGASDTQIDGLAFRHDQYLPPGGLLRLSLPKVDPSFQVRGWVRWCRRRQCGYLVGLVLSHCEDIFRLRQAEQLCHIHHYRRCMLVEHGRSLALEEAASEWVAAYASRFPAA